MAAPYFYSTAITSRPPELELDEDTSRHVVSVLRMKKGEQVRLTDGQGRSATGTITNDHKKHCRVSLADYREITRPVRRITVAVSLVKNNTRFEWFLEKATEIGIGCIIPLLCERTERQKFRIDRMRQICVSAMLQSQQCWLPDLQEPLRFEELVARSTDQQKFIAHCIEEEKRNLQDLVNETLNSQLVLVGPEGDFTAKEIAWAMEHHFIPVALGDTRLRTETAGVVASVILKLNA